MVDRPEGLPTRAEHAKGLPGRAPNLPGAAPTLTRQGAFPASFLKRSSGPGGA